MPQHRAVRREQERQREWFGGRSAQRLRQQSCGQAGCNNCGQSHQNEACAPAESNLQNAADHRRHDRREGADRSHQRQFPRRAHTGIEVTHDRARQHDRARSADALKKTRRQQRVDRLRHRANGGAGYVDRERGKQHRTSAIAIRQRTIKYLPDGKADQIIRHRKLNARLRRFEDVGDIRQRRQIHVDRQRAERS